MRARERVEESYGKFFFRLTAQRKLAPVKFIVKVHVFYVLKGSINFSDCPSSISIENALTTRVAKALSNLG